MPSQINITSIPSSRVDFIDPRTGLMSREWYRFFINLYNLTGGGNNATSLDDLQVGPPSGGGESAFGTVTSVAMTVPTGLSVTGSPITSAGTLAVSYSSGYSIPTTAKQTQWDTAYSERQQWDGGATNLVASTGRTSLGGTTVGSNFFTLTNPSAITFTRINADNTVSALDAATFRTAIGAGTGSGTVTSVAATAGTGISVTGSPITSSGTLTITNTAPAPSITNDTATATPVYPLFAAATSGTPTTLYTSNAKYLYTPSTGELAAPVHNSTNGITVNSQTVSASYTIASGSNGFSVGPITISSGQAVTVASGSVWVVI